MTIMVRILAGAAGLAALAGAAPASAERFSWNTPQMAVDRCTDAVQTRLNLRTAYGKLNGARVTEVTSVSRKGKRIHVRGLASTSGDLGPYGVGAYGALGASFAPNLTFECSVDRFGRIDDIDVHHR
ncbi:MAG TPA: hypothetical protein VJ775_04985 [Sphingomicrobium sp.]|nr:hypothetical protein [Sphingomicrobium sp.]